MLISTQYCHNNQKYKNMTAFQGWKPNTSVKSKQLNELVQMMINPENQRIAISGHIKPDGDCIGASIALANMINQATGKTVDLFLFGGLPKKFQFLRCKNINFIDVYEHKDFKADKLSEQFGQYDLAITLDTSSKRLIFKDFFDAIFKKAKSNIKIDHHPYEEKLSNKTGKMTSNNFAQYNYIDTTVDSASQIIMQLTELLKLKPKNLDRKVTEALYTGIISDTYNFQHARNPQAFSDAALLIKNGIDNVEMQYKLKGELSPTLIKLRQYLENNTKFSSDGKIAYIIEDKALLKLKQEAAQEGNEDEAKDIIKCFLSDMLQLNGVEISIKISGTNFSVRSKNADVRAMALKYGGGGHENAAAFNVTKDNKNISDIMQGIINEFQNQLLIKEAFSKRAGTKGV